MKTENIVVAIISGKLKTSLLLLFQETEKKREAFMQLLAQRYPQYAEKIQGTEASALPQGLPQEKVRIRHVKQCRPSDWLHKFACLAVKL